MPVVGYYGIGILTLENLVKVSRNTCSCGISEIIYYEVEISRLYLWDIMGWDGNLNTRKLSEGIKNCTYSCLISESVHYEVEISRLYLWDIMGWDGNLKTRKLSEGIKNYLFLLDILECKL